MTAQTFPTDGPINLDCRLAFGQLTVQAEHGATSARVTLAGRPGTDPELVERTVVRLAHSRLTVHVPSPRRTLRGLSVFGAGHTERDALDIEIVVPAGTALRIASWGADIVVHGRSGSADISAGSTTTTVAEVDGDLRLRIGSGPATISRVTGAVIIKSGSGDAHLGEVGGDVDMACGSGSLDVGTAHGSVRLRTGSGYVSVARALADIDLTSGSGGLRVGLPAGQVARLDIVTGRGQLHSELQVHDTAPSAERGSILLRARTGSGDIHLFHAA